MLEQFKEMWSEGLVPKSAQADNGANFTALFKSGKIGIQGCGGFLISDLKRDVPNMNFGVTFLPGMKDGEVSAFVGGDVVAIPVGSKHVPLAKAFIAWELTDEAQLEGLAKNNILPSRPALADNKYFAADPRIVTTAKALGDRLRAVGLSFRRYGQFGLEPLDQHAAARDLRRRRRRRDQGSAGEDEGDRRPSKAELRFVLPQPHATAATFRAVGRAGSTWRRPCFSSASSSSIPLGQLVAMSMTDRSLLGGGRFVGFGNYIRIWNDAGFWRALLFTVKYTIVLTPILMILGFALALLTADNTPLEASHAHDRLPARRHRAQQLEPALVLAVRRTGRPAQQAA